MGMAERRSAPRWPMHASCDAHGLERPGSPIIWNPTRLTVELHTLEIDPFTADWLAFNPESRASAPGEALPEVHREALLLLVALQGEGVAVLLRHELHPRRVRHHQRLPPPLPLLVRGGPSQRLCIPHPRDEWNTHLPLAQPVLSLVSNWGGGRPLKQPMFEGGGCWTRGGGDEVGK